MHLCAPNCVSPGERKAIKTHPAAKYYSESVGILSFAEEQALQENPRFSFV